MTLAEWAAFSQILVNAVLIGAVAVLGALFARVVQEQKGALRAKIEYLERVAVPNVQQDIDALTKRHAGQLEAIQRQNDQLQESLTTISREHTDALRRANEAAEQITLLQQEVRTLKATAEIMDRYVSKADYRSEILEEQQREGHAKSRP